MRGVAGFATQGVEASARAVVSFATSPADRGRKRDSSAKPDIPARDGGTQADEQTTRFSSSQQGTPNIEAKGALAQKYT